MPPILRREIRLLQIKPDGDYRFVMQTSLRHGLGYIALYYEWIIPSALKFKGTATQIHVDGRPFCVTPNLHAALTMLSGCLRALMAKVWIDAICIYQDRYRSKYCRNLRFETQFCEGVGFAHLTCRIGKFTLRVFMMEIYQYIAFHLHLTIPPSRRLARSSSQYDHVSLF